MPTLCLLEHGGAGIYWAAITALRCELSAITARVGQFHRAVAAQYLRGKGRVVVVAAATAAGWKALQPTISMLTVAATDQNDARASFSSYGALCRSVGPGVSVYTTTVGGAIPMLRGRFLQSGGCGRRGADVVGQQQTDPADVDRI